MHNNRDNPQDIVQIAEMYFRKNMSQTNIADEMGITQTQVSKLVNKARRENYIDFIIKDPNSTTDIQKKVKDKYPHLEELILVDCYDDENLVDNLGMRAARYFENHVVNGDSVSLSSGHSIYAMTKYLRKNRYNKLSFFPFCIKATHKIVALNPITVLAMIANNYDSKQVVSYAYQLPPFPREFREAKKKKQEYLENIHIKYVLNESKISKFKFFGIGTFERLSRAGEFSELIDELEISKEKIEDSGAIGEISYLPFSEKSEILIDTPTFKKLKTNFIYVSIEDLKKCVRENREESAKKVIAVAGGHHKRKAIKASLGIKCFNVLITDLETGKFLAFQKEASELLNND